MSGLGHCGAYGLQLTEGTDTGAWAHTEPPQVMIRQVQRAPRRPAVGPDIAIIDLPDDRQVMIDRVARTATFSGPPLTPDELTHPYLGVVASVFQRWAGNEVYHAGAFVYHQRAWAVVGPREAGKSTLLAALAGRGLPVLADDLVMTDGQEVYPGPRCIDLRSPVPGMDAPLRRARRDTRWRLPMPALGSPVPLGGWIYLLWKPEVAMQPVAASVLLGRLAGRRTWTALASDPQTLLALAGRPAWDFGRPADWKRLEEAIDVMLAALPTSEPPTRVAPGQAAEGRCCRRPASSQP